jgi:hypothetical protein
MTATADFGTSALNAFARAAGLLLLAVGALFAFAFAFAAIIVVGIMILGAAVAMRLMPQRAASGGQEVLEARNTPAGWVVEAAAKRKS